MEGDARRATRAAFRRPRAQATIEFAFSAPLLLLCLFATIDAAAWALQNSAAVAAAEEGARIAASAAGTPVGQHAPSAAQVTRGVTAQLEPALFATSVRPWGSPRCPRKPDEVEAAFGPRVVAVCVRENDPPPCTTPATAQSPALPLLCDDSPTVSVRVVGFMASLVPPGFGLGRHGGEIAVDVSATTHTLRFVR